MPDAVMYHVRCNRDFIPHSHDAVTILIVTEGVVDIRVDHRQYRAQPGYMVVVGANQIHSAHLLASDWWKMRILHLPTSHMRNVLGGELAKLHFTRPVQPASRIVSTFLDLHSCTESMNTSCGDFQGFLKDLYRDIDTFGPKHNQEDDVDQRVVRAKNIMTGFISENIQMTEIAEEVGFSVFSFIRRFEKAFGLPPSAWRTQARANEAAKLLRDGKQAAEVAALSGFADQPHMARTFKKVFGITPGQYCTMNMNTLRVGTRGPRYNFRSPHN